MPYCICLLLSPLLISPPMSQTSVFNVDAFGIVMLMLLYCFATANLMMPWKTICLMMIQALMMIPLRASGNAARAARPGRLIWPNLRGACISVLPRGYNTCNTTLLLVGSLFQSCRTPLLFAFWRNSATKMVRYTALYNHVHIRLFDTFYFYDINISISCLFWAIVYFLLASIFHNVSRESQSIAQFGGSCQEIPV